jgi:hypothetical protein
MKIDFKLFDLKIDKVYKPIAYYVELEPDRFVYHIEAIIDKEDPEDVEENIYTYEDIVYKKSTLIGTFMEYQKVEDQELWLVHLETAGKGELYITFDNKKEAIKFKKQLLNYIFNE